MIEVKDEDDLEADADKVVELNNLGAPGLIKK